VKGIELLADFDITSGQIENLPDVLAPFLKTARGIPSNWPDPCSLFHEVEALTVYLNYHGIGINAGPTIGDYRKLEEWVQAYRDYSWHDGPPTRPGYYLLQFAKGDRFVTARYYTNEFGEKCLENQNNHGYISDPVQRHLEIPKPQD
jgi:hypothetical protein